MKVNFNGMRINATQSMNRLYDAISEILDDSILVDSNLQKNLIEKFNDSAYHVDIFNCLQDDKEENFNALDISIDRFKDD